MGLDFALVSEVFDTNITHNLHFMAKKAGIYECLWCPDEGGYYYARDIIEPLMSGLENLKNNREYYEYFNSPNGWGTYEQFVPFVEEILNNCRKFPDAIIQVDR